ncbi:MAG: immunoglobulin-like domain-containing protein [Candidatus Izemoplasmatales bacterium]
MRRFLIVVMFLSTFLLLGCAPIAEGDVTIVLRAGVDTVEINDVFVDAGAKATAGWLPLSVEVVENTVDVAAVGFYRIVYRCTYKDIVKEVVRYVAVVDEIPPVVVLNAGVDTILKGDVWTDAGVTATDDGGTVSVTVRGVVTSDIPGEYIITYVATDGAGNETVAVRYVNVLRSDNG